MQTYIKNIVQAYYENTQKAIGGTDTDTDHAPICFLYPECEAICNDWEQHVKFDDRTYCKNILYRDDHIECILIGWLPGQASPLHGHPENGCLMRVLSGS